MTNERDFINYYLTSDYQLLGYTYRSSLIAALRDARLNTGRNVGTGALEHPDRAGSWLGAIGYLLILDQIGSCLKPRYEQDNSFWEKMTPKGIRYPGRISTIEKAIRDFGSSGPLVARTIYYLRCALAHDYSLMHQTRNGQYYSFSLQNTDESFVVRIADEPYLGPGYERSEDTTNVINLRGLADSVEAIYVNLVELQRERKLEIALAGGVDELMQRYFIIIGL